MTPKRPSLVRRLAIASAVGIGALVGPMAVAPAGATSITCEETIEPVCIAAVRVVCKVVAKGNACLY